MRTGYEYMIQASKQSQHDGDLWMRYLYKVIQDDDVKLSPGDVTRLLDNPILTPFQKVTLQDALTDGTHMHEHVIKASRKAQPRNILQLFKEGRYGQEATVH